MPPLIDLPAPDLLVQLREAFKTAIENEGLLGIPDDEGDLAFTLGDDAIWIIFDKTGADPSFVEITSGPFFHITRFPADVQRAYEAVNRVNHRVKLGRVTLRPNEDNQVWAQASVEVWLNNPAMVSSMMLIRFVSALKSAQESFTKDVMADADE